HRAVHGARVEVAQAEPAGDAAGGAGLAGARGAVDRHDDAGARGIAHETCPDLVWGPTPEGRRASPQPTGEALRERIRRRHPPVLRFSPSDVDFPPPRSTYQRERTRSRKDTR